MLFVNALIVMAAFLHGKNGKQFYRSYQVSYRFENRNVIKTECVINSGKNDDDDVMLPVEV